MMGIQSGVRSHIRTSQGYIGFSAFHHCRRNRYRSGSTIAWSFAQSSRTYDQREDHKGFKKRGRAHVIHFLKSIHLRFGPSLPDGISTHLSTMGCLPKVLPVNGVFHPVAFGRKYECPVFALGCHFRDASSVMRE